MKNFTWTAIAFSMTAALSAHADPAQCTTRAALKDQAIAEATRLVTNAGFSIHNPGFALIKSTATQGRGVAYQVAVVFDAFDSSSGKLEGLASIKISDGCEILESAIVPVTRKN